MPDDDDAFGASLDLFRMDSGWDRLLNAGVGMEACTPGLFDSRPCLANDLGMKSGWATVSQSCCKSMSGRP